MSIAKTTLSQEGVVLALNVILTLAWGNVVSFGIVVSLFSMIGRSSDQSDAIQSLITDQ